jgi:hypothetical protein
LGPRPPAPRPPPPPPRAPSSRSLPPLRPRPPPRPRCSPPPPLPPLLAPPPISLSLLRPSRRGSRPRSSRPPLPLSLPAASPHAPAGAAQARPAACGGAHSGAAASARAGRAAAAAAADVADAAHRLPPRSHASQTPLCRMAATRVRSMRVARRGAGRSKAIWGEAPSACGQAQGVFKASDERPRPCAPAKAPESRREGGGRAVAGTCRGPTAPSRPPAPAHCRGTDSGFPRAACRPHLPPPPSLSASSPPGAGPWQAPMARPH